MATGPDQLDMFGAPKAPPKLLPANVSARVHELGAQLESHLHLGTSSWSFPGWAGLVYDRPASTSLLSRQGLRAYGQHPLFRTVGVDRTFYKPVDADVLAGYAEQVPDDFRFLVKAYGGCTLARFGHDARHGALAGRTNPNFLEPGYARDEVVGPFVEGLGHKGGVLLFQFSPQALAPLGGAAGLPERLHSFFEALPKLEHGHYAVELRNPELFTPRYVQALEAVEVEHCINALPRMQSVPVQYAATGGTQRRALVVRWMLHRSHDYQGAKQAYAPFDRIVDEDVGTRRDIAAVLVPRGQAAEPGPREGYKIPTYLIVNNKAEGSSPESILRLVESLVGREP